MGFIAGATQYTAQQVGGSGICAAIGALAVGPWVAEHTNAAPPAGCSRALLQDVEHYVRYMCDGGLTYDPINGIGVNTILVSQVPVYLTMIVFGLIGWAIGWLILRSLVRASPAPAAQTSALTIESKPGPVADDRAAAAAPKQRSKGKRKSTSTAASAPVAGKQSGTKPRPPDAAS